VQRAPRVAPVAVFEVGPRLPLSTRVARRPCLSGKLDEVTLVCNPANLSQPVRRDRLQSLFS
jgi:hypothetical protein